MGIKVRLRHPRPLLRAAVELVHALNAFRPLGRKGYVTFLAFWFGWRTTEVPHLFMTASMIDAVRRARRGDFAGRRGKAALALTAASWAILAVIYRRGMASRPQLLDPLREELGVDYTDSLASLPSPPSQTRRPSAWRTAFVRRRYVEKGSVVRYGPYGRANLADVWRRVDLPRDGKVPVVVQVPGGGWVIGWRRPQAYPLMGHLADRGWICVSLNYRVSPLHTWPDHMVDVKRGAGMGEGEHRIVRRRPRLRRDHRWLSRRPSGGARRVDPERPAVPAGIRRFRDVGGDGDPDVRSLRLGQHPR